MFPAGRTGCAPAHLLAALLQVKVRKREAVPRCSHGLEPRAGLRVLRKGCGQQAQTPVLPTTDSAAQLMELADTEPIGVHHHHQGGIGYVHTDFDHRRAHQHVDLSGTECRHHRVLLVGG